MPDTPMIDDTLVTRLITSQFPQWSHLPLKRVEAAGSDNVIYRLGDTKSVRLPRGSWAAEQAHKEQRWLPKLAPRLPLAVPEQLGLGRPAFDYPWHWSVAGWLPGHPAGTDALVDADHTAVSLANFLTALQSIAADEALSPEATGKAADTLASRDSTTRASIAAVSHEFDAAALLAVWEAAMTAPPWSRSAVWFHGDMHNGNILLVDGHLSAVIDFGGLGIGDPACDLVIAWTLMSSRTRRIFRNALGVDDATWARGRGWAIATGLNAYRAYAATDARIAANTRHQIAQAIADET